MQKFILGAALILISRVCLAQEGLANSVMFQNPRSSVLYSNQNREDEILRQEEERRRKAYEEQMRQEEEKRRQEAIKKAEEERKKALRPVNLFGNEIRIFAEVNGEIITSQDMQERVNAFVATTQIPVNKQTKDMIIGKVLQSAIDEKVKIQEAQKNGIKISDKELEEGMKNFAKANGISLAKFRNMLKESGVKESVFKAQMAAEMGWSRLVQRKAAQEVKVTQGEVNDALKQVSEDIKMPKFMVSEIVIAKKDGKHIEDLVSNLRQDPRFELYAMQFSQSPSAQGGGRLGWINKGMLAQPLEQALSKMKEGDISNPISLGSDYYILRLDKVYRPGIDKAPEVNETEIRNMLISKKTEEMAAKYLKDIRNKAVVNIKN